MAKARKRVVFAEDQIATLRARFNLTAKQIDKLASILLPSRQAVYFFSDDAKNRRTRILQLTQKLIKETRYHHRKSGIYWEVNEFLASNNLLDPDYTDTFADEIEGILSIQVAALEEGRPQYRPKRRLVDDACISFWVYTLGRKPTRQSDKYGDEAGQLAQFLCSTSEVMTGEGRTLNSAVAAIRSFRRRDPDVIGWMAFQEQERLWRGKLAGGG